LSFPTLPSCAKTRPSGVTTCARASEGFTGLRGLVRTGAEWRRLPHDFPRWDAVSQQTRRGLDAGVFAALVHDLRTLLRLEAGRAGPPAAALLDSKTLQRTPASGSRAGYDGHKRRKGAQLHAAVDTLGHLLALHVTPADAQDRAPVAALAAAVQEATGETVELAYVDQGYTGDEPAEAAATYGLRVEVVKLPETTHGFVLLPKR
jgi:transposase